MAKLWFLGVCFEILSTMCGTGGKLLIRFSELLRRDDRLYMSKVSLIVGLGVNTAVGPIIDMAAYTFAAQSLIAPFGGLDIVWSALLAPYLLKEKLTWGRGVGCLCILTGATIAGVCGSHEEADYSLQYLLDTLISLRVLVYFLFYIMWFLFNNFYLMRFPPGSVIRGISLGCTAGTLAGNMFCVKGAVELIRRSIQNKDGSIWLHWLPYVLLLCAAFFAISNVFYMTRGLQEYEALFFVTIYEGSMIISGCLTGAIVLVDLRNLEPWRIGVYWLGVMTILCGMTRIFIDEWRGQRRCAATLPSETATTSEEGGVIKQDASGGSLGSGQQRCWRGIIPSPPCFKQKKVTPIPLPTSADWTPPTPMCTDPGAVVSP